MPSDTIPAILRGGRFTTNNADVLDFLRICALLLYTGEDRSFVIAKVHSESEKLVGVRNFVNLFDCADTNVQPLQVLESD
jgi:hypothetical protein